MTNRIEVVGFSYADCLLGGDSWRGVKMFIQSYVAGRLSKQIEGVKK